MTPLDAAIVRRRLRRIRANLTTLSGITSELTLDIYKSDEIRRRAIERLLQETIDAAVDINNHLLRAAGRAPAEDLYSSFVEIGRAGIVDMELASALAPSAGLRNRIVHEYEDLDDAQVLRAAQLAPATMTRFLAAVETYLSSRGL